jgi:hypothetical protein
MTYRSLEKQKLANNMSRQLKQEARRSQREVGWSKMEGNEHTGDLLFLGEEDVLNLEDLVDARNLITVDELKATIADLTHMKRVKLEQKIEMLYSTIPDLVSGKRGFYCTAGRERSPFCVFIALHAQGGRDIEDIVRKMLEAGAADHIFGTHLCWYSYIIRTKNK